MAKMEFKGKRITKDEWWTGFYIYSEYDNKHYIVQDARENNDAIRSVSFCHFVEVHAESILRLTGLKNGSGDDVCEGDIVKVGGLVELVCYIDGILCCYSPEIYGDIKTISLDDENSQNAIVSDATYFEPYEIIGNIYENPKLLDDE